MQLIAYYDQNELRLKPFSYLEEKAKTESVYKKLIKSNRLYQLGEINSESEIASIESAAETVIPQIKIPEIWEKIQKKYKNQPVKAPIKAQELAELLDLELNPINHLAIFLSIHRSQHYFKRKDSQFFPRSAKEIKERQRTTQELDHLTTSLKATLVKFKGLGELDEIAELAIEQLKQLAADPKQLSNEVKRELKNHLQKASEDAKNFNLSGNDSLDAFNFLKCIDPSHDYTEILLLKNQINTKISGAGKKELQEINNKFTELTKKIKRKDLTNIRSFTIDDPSTKDMDDAISLEKTADGYTLGIHISDVSCLVSKKSELDKIAKNRASSIYTANRIINMFPDELAENLASLIAGELRPCLSVIYRIDPQFKIISKKIQPTVIKVSDRLDYKQVDQMLELEDQTMLDLYQITIENETNRLANDAVKMPKQVSEIKMVDGELKLLTYDENDFTRNIIAELMVMANAAFAEYAAMNFLPAFFRGQDPKDPGDQSDNFKPSFTSITAKPHSSLGLTAYLQATSPIRRYYDLINQRQIVAHIATKQAVYDRRDLEKIRKLTMSPLKNVTQVGKEAKRYYLLKYLANNYPSGSIFDAEVIKNEKKLGLVKIKELLITGLVAIPKSYPTGQQIRVKLLEVCPEKNMLSLEEVQ